ncbi:N-acetylglutamate synthase, GNAT family [Cetobacterium ceti]|uniref:N-acetylglutamate synthase, GNAT family n=1 Tax=Cetobacterium ceti TaxID=180163 RepID=A0A1T4MVR7_9FUSO|nr:GNAT family N-acetyltransferase [Cetobacterium ceti]SJZ70944.1 N-acetylglutamate synthase, GNAT family [Cetobacterium ceti]
MIKIREIREDDFYMLTNLYKELENENVGNYLEYQSELISDGNKKIIVAEQRNKIVGAIEFCIFEGKIYLENLIVAQGYRNNGVGSLLLEMVKDYAKDLEIDNINVKIYYYDGKIINFYEKNGFEDISKEMCLKVK